MVIDLKTVLTILGSGGIATLITAFITHRMTKQRENIAAQRSFGTNNFREIKDLYAETIAFIDEHIDNKCRGDKDYANKVRQINAKISLLGNDNIRSCFEKVIISIQNWASESIQSEYKRSGDYIIITSYGKEKEHQEKADSLFPDVLQKFEDLKKAMRSHIEELESNVIKLNGGKRK